MFSLDCISQLFSFPPRIAPIPSKTEFSADTRLIRKQKASDLGAQNLQFLPTRSSQRDSTESTAAMWAWAHLPGKAGLLSPLLFSHKLTGREWVPISPFSGLQEASSSATVHYTDDHNSDHPSPHSLKFNTTLGEKLWPRA